MVGMPNKLAAYSSGGTLWLPVKVLWSFVVIDNDDVVKGKVFSFRSFSMICDGNTFKDTSILK